MLKPPACCHLIYYKNIEWASLEWGHLLFLSFFFSRDREKKIQQKSVKSRWKAASLWLWVIFYFILLCVLGVGVFFGTRDQNLRPFPSSLSLPPQYLTTLIWTLIQRKLRLLIEKKERKQSRVLPRVELALMRFSCNYFSAITIRTTTTEDLIRQWEGLILLPGDSD